MGMTLEQVLEILTGASLNAELMEIPETGEEAIYVKRPTYLHSHLRQEGERDPTSVPIDNETFVCIDAYNCIRIQTRVPLTSALTEQETKKAIQFANALNGKVPFVRYQVIRDEYQNDGEGREFLYGMYFLDNEHPIGEKLLIKSVSRLGVTFLEGLREHDVEDEYGCTFVSSTWKIGGLD
jgi:hypothetical protein